MTTEIWFSKLTEIATLQEIPVCINCGAPTSTQQLLIADKKDTVANTKQTGVVPVPMCEKCQADRAKAQQLEWAFIIIGLIIGIFVAGQLLGNRLEEGFGMVCLSGVVWIAVGVGIAWVLSTIGGKVAPAAWAAKEAVSLNIRDDALVLTVRDDEWLSHIDTTGLTVKKLSK